MCSRLRLLTASYMPTNRNYVLTRFRGSKLSFSCSWQSGTVVAVDQGVDRCLHTALFNRNTELCKQYNLRTGTGTKGNLMLAPDNYVSNKFLSRSQLRSPLCMAVNLDISVLLKAVGAEHYNEELANNGVVTVEQCAALTAERLKECGIPTWRNSRIARAIGKAKALLSSRDDVVQQELLVSGTSLG